jgi:hypothetical protein
LIISAALYFEPLRGACVSLSLFEGLLSLFKRFGLKVSEFELLASGFTDDAVYSYEAERVKLISALSARRVRNLGLYSGLDLAEGRESWRAMASVELEGGIFLFGVDASLVESASLLLRDLVELCRSVVSIGYGISYQCGANDHPFAYATGIRVCSLSDALGEKNADLSNWLRERQGSRRYLRGFFRGAYPASVLSAEHIRALRQTRGKRLEDLGAFVDLGGGITLWELLASEIELAEAFLRQSELLCS